MNKSKNKTFSEETTDNEIKNRLESVKIITRIKGPVCNWDDMEKEIMKGAI